MMDFNERVIPNVSSNFMFQEAISRYEFAKKYLKKNEKVIDFGCGTGYGEKFLYKDAIKVVGIDINNDAIKFAKKNYGKFGSFYKKSVMDTKFRDGEFDFAVSFEVIEHLKDQKMFLKEVKRVLKKNSYFIMSTPNVKFSQYSSEYHEKEFDYQELYKILSSEFRRVKIYGQTHGKNALIAWSEFLNSQNTRQSFVNTDKFGIRKLIPKSLKEKMWKRLGNFFGRKAQENLSTKDFPISYKNVKTANYFIAVCQK